MVMEAKNVYDITLRFRPFCVNPAIGTYSVYDSAEHVTVVDPPLTWSQAVEISDDKNKIKRRRKR